MPRNQKGRHPIPLPPPSEKALRLMWPKIKVPDECWTWTGTLHKEDGYPQSIPVDGSVAKKAKQYRPQRLIFHWFKYAIPDGFTIDHLCKNRACVNPDHMEAVTHQENVSRALKRSYCKHGHAMVGENIYLYMNGKKRRCRACMKRKNKRSPTV